VRRLADHAPTLLLLAVTFWAGNFLIGRAVRADIPPVALAFGRWAGASLLLAPFAARSAWRERHALRGKWGGPLALSFTGVATFNTLVYLGLQTTTALNAFLLQALMPILILLLGVVAFGESATRRQVVGMTVSLLGAAWVILEGRASRLVQLDVALGDALVLVAVVSYAVYSVLLRQRPAMSGLPFAFVTFVLGTVMLAPFYLIESTVRPFDPNLAGIAALAYVMIFPSIASYLAFNRGVALIGSSRAGPYLHLMPILGSLGAVAILGEPFRSHHLVGVALVAAGIGLASRVKRAA